MSEATDGYHLTPRFILGFFVACLLLFAVASVIRYVGFSQLGSLSVFCYMLSGVFFFFGILLAVIYRFTEEEPTVRYEPQNSFWKETLLQLAAVWSLLLVFIGIGWTIISSLGWTPLAIIETIVVCGIVLIGVVIGIIVIFKR